MVAHAPAPLGPPDDDADDSGPVTARPSFDLVRLARELNETTAVIPSSLLIALRARAAQEEGPSQVEIVELDPSFVISVDGAFEEGTSRAQDGDDDDATDVGVDDIEAAFDALRMG